MSGDAWLWQILNFSLSNIEGRSQLGSVGAAWNNFVLTIFFFNKSAIHDCNPNKAFSRAIIYWKNFFRFKTSNCEFVNRSFKAVVRSGNQVRKLDILVLIIVFLPIQIDFYSIYSLSWCEKSERTPGKMFQREYPMWVFCL